MTAWLFRAYPDNDTPYRQYSQDGVIATGWPTLGDPRWKYGIREHELWMRVEEPKAHRKNAANTFRFLLCPEDGGVKPGDLILAVCGIEGQPRNFKVLGVGRLGENPTFEFKSGYPPTTTNEQPHTLGPIEWKSAPRHEEIGAEKKIDSGLTPADPDQTRQIEQLWKNLGGSAERNTMAYSQEPIEESRMETKIIDLLRDARQLILFGPPGTGKTYTAKRAAARLLGNTWPAEEEATTDALDDGRDDQRFILVVFHPSYEYDQFIGGLTVDVSAEQQELQYRLQTGPLLAMCEHAAAHPDDTHVLLIDEINRGNLSKLLGELLHALEYRDEKVTLPFRSDPLVVPKNLYIIATMNSSDRSIGHIDVATRRRFALFHVPPDSAVVRSKWENQWGDAESGERLAGAMEAINQKLREEGKDEDLGVGQSYFLPYRGCDEKSAVVSVLRKINHSLLPLLREYDEMIGHTGDSCLAPEEEFENLDAVFECKRWLA